jgi:hypothetical protein
MGVVCGGGGVWREGNGEGGDEIIISIQCTPMNKKSIQGRMTEVSSEINVL